MKNYSQNLIHNVLTSSAYIVINKHLLRIFGGEATILLGDLASKDLYFKNKKKNYDGWFFNTAKNMTEDTRQSYHKQKTALDWFKGIGLIETKRVGVPAKLYFKINYEMLEKLLKTSIESPLILDIKNFNNLKLNSSKTINKNKDNKNKINKNKSKSHSRNREISKRRRLSELELDKRFKFNRYVELSNQLREMIINANRVIPKTQSPEQWAVHLQRIETVDGVPYKEIKKRMNLYSTMVKSAISKNPEYNKYTPQCFSGASFREKFEKIGDAAAKRTGKGNDRPNTMYFEHGRDRKPTHKTIKM